ncbi:hypothetical protein MRB53_041222 [Persea americana]|nr:hypothetical protein MRB53_041222 [Persea americana]
MDKVQNTVPVVSSDSCSYRMKIHEFSHQKRSLNVNIKTQDLLSRTSLANLTSNGSLKTQLTGDTAEFKIKPHDEIERVILCTGQVFAALFKHRQAHELTDTAIVRIEQLNPFPWAQLRDNLDSYPNAKDYRLVSGRTSQCRCLVIHTAKNRNTSSTYQTSRQKALHVCWQKSKCFCCHWSQEQSFEGRARFLGNGMESVQGSVLVLLLLFSERLQKDKDAVLDAIQERGYSCQVKTWSCDLTDFKQIQATLKEIESFGSVECLLYNAARVGGKPPLEESTEAIELDFKTTNLALYEVANGLYHC